MTIRVWLSHAARAVVVSAFCSTWDPAVHAQPASHGQHHQPPSSVIDLPHGRHGSGTTWQPDASPTYAFHRETGEWQVMGHGNLFLQYLDAGSDRGGDQFGSVNWAMAMATRPLGRGRLAVRGMLSVEPVTIGGCGYPNLLASGEVCDGAPIVDRQHPHDLFMEAAVQYDRPLSPNLGLQIYGGLAGEPALGPVAFPHRLSSMPNPLAPMSHHWLDATHITYGVLTGGLYGRQWKAEGSIFNGREPDDERYDFDVGTLDSFSGRAWYLPHENLALQVSAGQLTEAEIDLDSGGREDVARLTASATWQQPFRDGSSNWAATLAWGRNSEDGVATSFVLAEASVLYDEQDAWYGRFEVGRKGGHDLDVEPHDRLFTLGKLQAGYTRYLEEWNGLKPGLGATLSLNLVPSALDAVYGNRATLGFGVYLTLRPAQMTMR